MVCYDRSVKVQGESHPIEPALRISWRWIVTEISNLLLRLAKIPWLVYTRNMEPLELAIIKAVQAHAGQRDADGSLHIAHCISVMVLSQKEAYEKCPSGVSVEDLQCAAILHDTIEDSGTTLEEICAEFGDIVANTVDALSHRKGESYRDYIYRCKSDPAARLIKICDLLHNMSRTHKVSAKKASWREKLEYKYRIASLVLNGKWEPTWEGASYEVRYEDATARFYIADPDGKEIEITEKEAKNVKASFKISN